MNNKLIFSSLLITSSILFGCSDQHYFAKSPELEKISSSPEKFDNGHQEKPIDENSQTTSDPAEIPETQDESANPSENPDTTPIVDNFSDIKKEFFISASSRTICNPMGNEEESTNNMNKGLVGEIRLLKSNNDSGRNLLSTYLDENKSYKVDGVKLFASQVNVPSRYFSEGFETKENIAIEIGGRKLDEWFNVNYESILKINDSTLQGEYEFAIVSDDGARLYFDDLNDDLLEKLYLRKDSTQAPAMLCASDFSNARIIDLRAGMAHRLKINYFQGPRYHIALQLFWRKKDLSISKSPLCGRGIGDAQQDQLHSEGWEIVPPSVFNLPGTVINTCYLKTGELSELKLGAYKIKDDNISVKINDVPYSDEFSIIEKAEDGEMNVFLLFKEKILLDLDKKIEIRFDLKD